MLEGIGPFPNDVSKRTVISLSSPRVHTVQIKSKRKECAICAHIVAVAYQVGKLRNFVA